MAIVTTATFKTYRGIAVTTYDAQLDVIVPQAIDDFQTYTGRTLDTASFTEKHDGNDQKSITLFNAPVASITSVTLTTPSGSSSTIPTTALAFDVNSGVLKFDPPGAGILADWNGWFPDEASVERRSVWSAYPCFPKGHQNITVVYVGGYASNTYPAGMQGAIYQYIDGQLAQARLGVGALAFKSKTLGNHTWTLADPPGMGGDTNDREHVLYRLFYRFKRLGGGQ